MSARPVRRRKLPEYSKEPKDAAKFTKTYDRFYSSIAAPYSFFSKIVPVYRRWLKESLPYIEGPRVLEISFGPGYLMTQYAGRFEVYGIDYNSRMVQVAGKNLKKAGLTARLQQGNVENLPYEDAYFDTVLSTMAFSGYPNARKALSEMLRVLKPHGRLIIEDANFPKDGNKRGTLMTRLIQRFGDIIRDMDELFDSFGVTYEDKEIGGWGSIHLYLVRKTVPPPGERTVQL